jgi:hypothetical protein
LLLIHETVKEIWISGPRLDFNTRDGLLYYSNKLIKYTINPTSGALITTRTIKGLIDNNGGDLAFAKDGTFIFYVAFLVIPIRTR